MTRRPGREPCRSRTLSRRPGQPGVDWFVAEQDEPDDVLHDIKLAFEYLEGLALVH